jgi:hypothetical protein
MGCKRKTRLLLLSITTVLLQATACASVQSHVEEPFGSLVIGRAIAAVTGERHRIYEPTIRWLEIESRTLNVRHRLKLQPSETEFFLVLAPGEYQVNRVQISEGPFLSMAQLDASFTVGPEPITNVGTWRFGVDSPRYGRMVRISMVSDDEDGTRLHKLLLHRYPDLVDAIQVVSVPQPSQAETRLYEVTPYPRYPRYFRWHWW